MSSPSYDFSGIRKNMSRVLIFTALGLIVFAILISYVTKDVFGNFEHPENAWQTDCLMFFSKPVSLDRDRKLVALFGYDGEGGVASELAAKHDSALNVMYNFSNGNTADNCAYIVYLIHGTDCLEAMPSTYFQLCYMDGDRVVYDESDGMIEVGDAEAYGDVKATLDMSKAPAERLSVKLTDDNAYGAIVIPVKFNFTDDPTGTMVFVDMSVALERENMRVDSGEKFVFADSPDVDFPVEISDLSIGYLTEKDYNHGEYDESSITKIASFENDSPLYAVIDVRVKALTNNLVSEKINIMTYLSDKSAASMKIQEAPTGNTEDTIDGNRQKLLAVYTISEKKGEEKVVRMIIKLVPREERPAKLDIFISVGDRTVLGGDTHASDALRFGTSD